MAKIKVPYSDLTAKQKLRALWMVFCDADPVPPGFIEELETAGFARLVPVSKDALEDSFAAERGIEPGGFMWELTPAGRSALTEGTKS